MKSEDQAEETVDGLRMQKICGTTMIWLGTLLSIFVPPFTSRILDLIAPLMVLGGVGLWGFILVTQSRRKK